LHVYRVRLTVVSVDNRVRLPRVFCAGNACLIHLAVDTNEAHLVCAAPRSMRGAEV